MMLCQVDVRMGKGALDSHLTNTKNQFQVMCRSKKWEGRASRGLAARGVACARSGGQCAGAERARVCDRRSGVRRGGAGPLVRCCGTGPRLGRGGGENGACEALGDSVISGRAAVVSWRGPCDGAGKKEAQ